jgi:hypothetical protein
VSKAKLQVIITLGLLTLWGLGAIVASFDGNTLLKVTTPLATMCFGWLFATKATEGSGG